MLCIVNLINHINAGCEEGLVVGISGSNKIVEFEGLIDITQNIQKNILLKTHELQEKLFNDFNSSISHFSSENYNDLNDFQSDQSSNHIHTIATYLLHHKENALKKFITAVIAENLLPQFFTGKYHNFILTILRQESYHKHFVSILESFENKDANHIDLIFTLNNTIDNSSEIPQFFSHHLLRNGDWQIIKKLIDLTAPDHSTTLNSLLHLPMPTKPFFNGFTALLQNKDKKIILNLFNMMDATTTISILKNVSDDKLSSNNLFKIAKDKEHRSQTLIILQNLLKNINDHQSFELNNLLKDKPLFSDKNAFDLIVKDCKKIFICNKQNNLLKNIKELSNIIFDKNDDYSQTSDLIGNSNLTISESYY